VTTIDVIDAQGSPAGTLDLPAEIFDVQVNIPLIHQVVVAQQAAARQGTHDTKGRGEVSGGGRKPYRQKGTGRARQGSIRAPQFAGGGVVHGPTPRSYDQRTPKKMKAAALRGALSDRARSGRVHVVESLVTGAGPSTRDAVAALARLSERPRALVVLERADATTWLSLRNVHSVHLIAVDQLNTYDVLVSDDVVFTRGAFDALVARVQASDSRRAASRSSAPAMGTAAGTPVGSTVDTDEPDDPADGDTDGVLGKVTGLTGAVAGAVLSTVASTVTGTVTGAASAVAGAVTGGAGDAAEADSDGVADVAAGDAAATEDEGPAAADTAPAADDDDEDGADA
jgi:large subunit ribosomal protein L4